MLSILDVYWEVFLVLALLPFWIFGMMSVKIFQLNSETRYGKLEQCAHVKSFWPPLEQHKKFCAVVVIWTINLQGVKEKSLCFDLCRKLPNMTKLLTSEKINLCFHELTKEVMLPSN